MWTYEQATGHLAHNGERHATGYSGNGEGKNNPAMQDHAGVGPIPKGRYTIVLITDSTGKACDYKGKKAPVMRLYPAEDNQMFGRDGFLIHGDSVSEPGEASLGCVIENHAERVAIASSMDRDLEVV